MQGLSYNAAMQGSAFGNGERLRPTSKGSTYTQRSCNTNSRTTHLAWRADLGLAGPSTAASPLYTYIDGEAVESGGISWHV